MTQLQVGAGVGTGGEIEGWLDLDGKGLVSAIGILAGGTPVGVTAAGVGGLVALGFA